MKTKFTILSLIAIAIVLTTGCANVSKKSDVVHSIVRYGVALPPSWKAVVPSGSNNNPNQATFAYNDFSFVSETNTEKGSLLSNGPKVFVAYKETWEDYSKGGGTFIFTDPTASAISSSVNNQTALGGVHSFTVGDFHSVISSNAVSAIGASGTAIGNIIKTASGTP